MSCVWAVSWVCGQARKLLLNEIVVFTKERAGALGRDLDEALGEVVDKRSAPSVLVVIEKLLNLGADPRDVR